MYLPLAALFPVALLTFLTDLAVHGIDDIIQCNARSLGHSHTVLTVNPSFTVMKHIPDCGNIRHLCKRCI